MSLSILGNSFVPRLSKLIDLEVDRHELTKEEVREEKRGEERRGRERESEKIRLISHIESLLSVVDRRRILDDPSPTRREETRRRDSELRENCILVIYPLAKRTDILSAFFFPFLSFFLLLHLFFPQDRFFIPFPFGYTMNV